jgi:hypothetical protein
MPTPMAEMYQPSPHRRDGTTTGMKKQNNNFNNEKYLQKGSEVASLSIIVYKSKYIKDKIQCNKM